MLATVVIIFVAVVIYFNQRAIKENNKTLNDLGDQTAQINQAKAVVQVSHGLQLPSLWRKLLQL